MTNDVQFTPLTDLFIDSEDCRNIKDFIEHFAIEPSPELTKALQEFETAFNSGMDRDILIGLQNNLRNRLCEFIVGANHPLFEDPLMNQVVSNANQISFLASFDRQVDEILRSED